MTQPPASTPPHGGPDPSQIDPAALAAAMAYLQQQGAPQQQPMPQQPAPGKKEKKTGFFRKKKQEPTQEIRNTREEDGEKDGQENGLAGAIKRFFTPASKNKDGKDGKSSLSSTLRRAQIYGGRRKYAVFLLALVAATTAFSMLSLIIASQSVTKNDVSAEVANQLEKQGAGFPSGQAVQWAGQVVRVMGTYDEASRDDYANQVSQFLSSGMDEMAGWNGKGHQQVAFVSVNPQPRIIDGSHAVVTAAYQTSEGKWGCMAVPTFAYKPSTYGTDTTWAFTLSALPTPTACAARTGLPKLPSVKSDAKEDDDTANTLAADFYPSFFAAWAASEDATLAQYTIDGFTTVGLGGAMESTPPPTIGDVKLLVDNKGKADTALATVEVTWTVTGSTSTRTVTYEMQMKHVGTKWLVASEPVPAYQSVSGSTAQIPAPEASDSPVPYGNEQPTPQTPNEGATTGNGDQTTAPTDSGTSAEG